MAEDLRHSSTWKAKTMMVQTRLAAQYCVLWPCSPCRVCWVGFWVWPGGTPGHRGKQSRSVLKQFLSAMSAQLPCCSCKLNTTRSWPSVIPQYLNASCSSQDKFQLRKNPTYFLYSFTEVSLEYNNLLPSLLRLTRSVPHRVTAVVTFLWRVRSLLYIAPNQDTQHPAPGQHKYKVLQ